MRSRNNDLIKLKREVLGRPPSAALPSNLSDQWLDAALQDVERVISADAATESEVLRLPLSLVLHLLNLPGAAEQLEISDDELFRCLRLYRLELAMEKLRRWGVQLAPPATESTIFASHRGFDSAF
jgi:hypothetical protein